MDSGKWLKKGPSTWSAMKCGWMRMDANGTWNVVLLNLY